MNSRGSRTVGLLALGMIAILAAAVAIAPRQRPAAQGVTMTVYVRLPLILKQPTSTATATSTVYVPPTSTPTATTAPAPCQCYADLYNCDDFGMQAQAQACYDYCWSLGYGDVHHLDADHDGIACEWLP